MNNVANFNCGICNDYFLFVITECSSANVSLYWYGRVRKAAGYVVIVRNRGLGR